MLDQRLLDLAGKALAKPKPAPPFSVTLEIPRDHPGLPRLCSAAVKLRHCEVVRPGGLRIKKTQELVLPGALEEFFSALRSVVGDTMADELEERLGARVAITKRDPADLIELCKAAGSLLPFGLLQKMAQG